MYCKSTWAFVTLIVWSGRLGFRGSASEIDSGALARLRNWTREMGLREAQEHPELVSLYASGAAIAFFLSLAFVNSACWQISAAIPVSAPACWWRPFCARAATRCARRTSQVMPQSLASRLLRSCNAYK
eukprot:scaffold31529_cov25-Prasinocladus_malaysianus.AAC.2